MCEENPNDVLRWKSSITLTQDKFHHKTMATLYCDVFLPLGSSSPTFASSLSKVSSKSVHSASITDILPRRSARIAAKAYMLALDQPPRSWKHILHPPSEVPQAWQESYRWEVDLTTKADLRMVPAAITSASQIIPLCEVFTIKHDNVTKKLKYKVRPTRSWGSCERIYWHFGFSRGKWCHQTISELCRSFRPALVARRR